jgi:hypothetical protein
MSKEKIIRWTPRILSIYLLVILYLLSIDVFEIDAHWTELLLGFLMHNIPAFILTIALIFAWKRPWIGAIIFALAGLFYIGFILYMDRPLMMGAIFTLSLPAFISSVFFYLDFRQSKK